MNRLLIVLLALPISIIRAECVPGRHYPVTSCDFCKCNDGGGFINCVPIANCKRRSGLAEKFHESPRTEQEELLEKSLGLQELPHLPQSETKSGLPAARNPWGGNRVDGIPSLLLTTARPIGRLLDFDLLQEQQLPPMLY